MFVTIFRIALETVLIIMCFCLFACQRTPRIDFEQEANLLLEMDLKAREFHFDKNAQALVSGFSPDFISINRGVISKPTQEESFQRFDNYFKHVAFLKWDNTTKPIVRFSADASVAYVAVDKLVVLKLKNENGKEVVDTTHFAWLSVYKKINSNWVLDCIASTNK